MCFCVCVYIVGTVCVCVCVTYSLARGSLHASESAVSLHPPLASLSALSLVSASSSNTLKNTQDQHLAHRQNTHCLRSIGCGGGVGDLQQAHGAQRVRQVQQRQRVPGDEHKQNPMITGSSEAIHRQQTRYKQLGESREVY